MKLTKEQLLNLVYSTMEEMNAKLETDFSEDTVEIAFFVPNNGIAVYEALCSRYFPSHLSEDYKKESFFLSFAAMAFVGEEKDGILIREDLDLSLAEWHHIILHELSHLLVIREELNGENFYQKYCVDYAENTEEDGIINAGYAIWREFSAEVFALDLDDSIMPYSLNDASSRINKLLPLISPPDPIAKEALQKSLNYLFKSDDYYFAEDEEEFIERIAKSKAKKLLDFELVIRHIYKHLSHECAWEIDLDFIRDLGYFYTLGATNKLLKNRILNHT